MGTGGLEQGRESDALGIEAKLLLYLYLLKCSGSKIADGQYTTMIQRSNLDAGLDMAVLPSGFGALLCL